MFNINQEESTNTTVDKYKNLITSKGGCIDRFEDWGAAEFEHTYTLRSVGKYMREQKERKELLLFNYGTERLAQLN